LAVRKKHEIDLLEFPGFNGKNVSKLTDDEVHTAKRMMDDAGISLSALGSPRGRYPIEADFAMHRVSFQRGLELAQTLGTDKVRMFSFFISSGSDAVSWSGKVIDQLGEMLDMVEKENILLCHENEKGIYDDTDDRCVNLLETFQMLECVFDPANFIQCSVNVFPAFERMVKRITYMHIKDVLIESGAVVPAGNGDADFATLISRFRMLDQPMVLTLEQHLTLFKGLSDLQEETLLHKYMYPDDMAAFSAAVEAVKALL